MQHTDVNLHTNIIPTGGPKVTASVGLFVGPPYQISLQFVKTLCRRKRGGKNLLCFWAFAALNSGSDIGQPICLFALANYISLAAHTCWAWSPLVKREKDIKQATKLKKKKTENRPPISPVTAITESSAHIKLI